MTFKHIVALSFLITLNVSLFGCSREYGWGNQIVTQNIEIPLSRFSESSGPDYFPSSPHSSPYASYSSPCSSPLSSSPAVVAVTYSQMKKRDSLTSQKESDLSFDEEFKELAKIEIE